MKVIPLRRKKVSPNIWKLEGAAFERVKAANKLFQEIAKTSVEENRKLEQKVRDAKVDFWHAVEAEMGEKPKHNLSFDDSAEELGIYFIRRESDEDCQCFRCKIARLTGERGHHE